MPNLILSFGEIRCALIWYMREHAKQSQWSGQRWLWYGNVNICINLNTIIAPDVSQVVSFPDGGQIE